jgi:hypothetical protein
VQNVLVFNKLQTAASICSVLYQAAGAAVLGMKFVGMMPSVANDCSSRQDVAC